MSIKRSPLMDQLYGTDKSLEVFNMLEALSPALNNEVQKIAYEHFWARPGLSIQDKSFVTVVSLISLGKEVQARSHMIGFMNTGGTKEELFNTLLYLSQILGRNSAKKGFDSLIGALQELHQNLAAEDMRSLFTNTINAQKLATIKLSKKHTHFINIVSCAVIGEQSKTVASIKTFLNIPERKQAELENIFIHMIPYCGFPTVVNAFSALNKYVETFKPDSIE